MVALAALMAYLLWPARSPRESPSRAGSPAPEPTAVQAQVTTAERVEAPALSAAPRGPRAPERRAAPPVVDEVTVEKPSVCSGEENLVTVHAHTTDGSDAFLHYVVDGSMGSSVPLRLLLGPDGKVEGRHTVTVFGRDNAFVSVPVPDYEVRDCQPEHVVLVTGRVQPNTWSEMGLDARVVTVPAAPAPAKKFVPASYTWAFGDGETGTTPGGYVVHDYEGRAQDTLYSYFTVRVDVRSADGELLTGRTTLPLINPAFEALAQKGIVQILIALDPRFPELGADGRVVQKVRLWHTRPDAVTIDAATVTRYFEGAAGETEPAAVDVASLLGSATIPPGSPQRGGGATTTVVLDTLQDPGVFSMTYRLSGRSREGQPVMGSFSVMRPPPRPTAENSQPVVQPALKAKVVAAREILGRDVVTDEDLWRLEREGRFAGLAASSAAPPAVLASAPTPPSLPNASLAPVGPPVPTGVTPPPAVTSAAEMQAPDDPATTGAK